jgi:hypothetical protein
MRLTHSRTNQYGREIEYNIIERIFTQYVETIYIAYDYVAPIKLNIWNIL